MNERQFSIKGTSESIDWNLIEAHREQAMKNHGQTLERLAEQGGLRWNELLWVLLDVGLNEIKLDSKEKYEKECRKALVHEELKQYREIGEVEELQDMKNNFFKTLNACRQYQKEHRTAAEKQMTKRPDWFCPYCGQRLESRNQGK